MPSIGESLAGRYRLDALIGSGGFATVFRARDLRLDRDVAVKVLLANHATDPVIARRFDREARVLAAVSHPNVVAIHDVEPGDPATAQEPFLVMDLCDGGSLADHLATAGTGAIPPDELVPTLIDVAAGLGALHARGIVHRDLKPSNILLSNGRARIADLGIAATGPSDLTAVGTTIGTLAYLAPEQLAGEPGSPASDVHALGAIAYLGLTGRLPRPAGSVTEIVAASVRRVEPVSALAPGLGRAFDEGIARALAGDPSQRPTATDLGATLEAALERWRAGPATMTGDDATTLIDVPLPGRGIATEDPAITPRRDGRMLAVVGILVAALLLGLAAFLLLGSDGSGGRASPSVAGGGGASPSASAGATPTATPTSTPTSSPTPIATVDPYGNARAASDEMRAAIEAAQGPGGLNGHELKDLENHLARFDRALDKHDPTTARDEASALAGQIAELIDQRAVDAQAGARLGTAADGLVTAANALPD
ncbi:MAG: serine/threonine-protein kinase [Candidatus Limnocylindrales bacterium]